MESQSGDINVDAKVLMKLSIMYNTLSKVDTILEVSNYLINKVWCSQASSVGVDSPSVLCLTLRFSAAHNTCIWLFNFACALWLTR